MNHVTAKVMNFQPLLALLFEKYGDNKDELVQALYDVRDFLMRDDSDDASEIGLRRVYNILNSLAVALDEITVQQLSV